MNHKDFEDAEQERFLDRYYDYPNSRLILTNLEFEDYSAIRNRTKTGIKEGVEDFLSARSQQTVYLSDLSEFLFDQSTGNRILEQLTDLESHDNLFFDNKEIYAQDVCETYRMFVYNESLDRFNELSKKK